MDFANHLNLLMNTFSISNSKLAKGINVDPSLISRWRTGKRCPAPYSPHIPAIAAFFLQLELHPYQKDFLDTVIFTGEANTAKNESKQMQTLITWLTAKEKASNKPVLQQGGRSDQFYKMNAITPRLLPFNPAANFPSQIEQESFHGHVMEYELFIGREGKRKAVLNFLNAVIRSKKTLELLLCSEEDITWLIEDPDFLNRWAAMMKTVIDNGHSITIIHVVNRDSSEIKSILNNWIPLHLYGNIKSFYYPKYIETPIRQTYFITRGISSIVSYDTHEPQLENCSFYFRDAFVTRIFENNFYAHLSQCKPLVKPYTETDFLSYMEQWLRMKAYSGCAYTISNSFNGLLLPDSLYDKLLLNMSAADAPRYKNIKHEWEDRFYAYLQHTKHYDILPLKLLDDIVCHQSYRHSDRKYLGKLEIDLTVEEIILYLENVVNALKKYPNYELYLSNQLPDMGPMEVSISFKENEAASFSTTTITRNNYTALVVDEVNILQAFSYYFDDYIHKIPSSNRKKTEVIRKLEKVISILHKSL